MRNISSPEWLNVQRILFKNGYTWISGETEIKDTSYQPPIIFNRAFSGNKLTLGYIGMGGFCEYKEPELTYDQFIKLYDK